MDILSLGKPFDTAKGHNVELNAISPVHIDDKPQQGGNDDVSTSFRDMLNASIGKVNDLQVDAESLNRQMIYQPESVDIHTVMIAGQKAEVALTFTKAVRDEAIRAYRELMNLR